MTGFDHELCIKCRQRYTCPVQSEVRQDEAFFNRNPQYINLFESSFSSKDAKKLPCVRMLDLNHGDRQFIYTVILKEKFLKDLGAL